MKQVTNEKAVAELAMALKAYDDSNPDVGMPPFFDTFVDRAIKQLGLERTDVCMQKVVDEVTKRRRG